MKTNLRNADHKAKASGKADRQKIVTALLTVSATTLAKRLIEQRVVPARR